MVAQMQAAAAENMSVEDYSAKQKAQEGDEKVHTPFFTFLLCMFDIFGHFVVAESLS